jgi:uncharacterized protein YdaT
MSERKSYHVLPAKAGVWLVRTEGSSSSSNTYRTKAEAVSGAKEIAKRQTHSQVIVHKRDGKVQTEYTYGGDPRRSKG